MPDETTTNGWVKLYHPTGAQVTFPVSLMAEITTVQVMIAFNSVNTLVAGGFSVNMPGLNDGELVDEIVSVARRAGNDGTPIIAFFVAHPKMVIKVLHVYLDTADDVADFERASGLRLASIPEFPGDKDITKDHRLAGQYIVNLAAPMKVVYGYTEKWKKWNAGDKTDAQPQKYELARYMSTGNGNGHIQPAPQQTASPAPTMTVEQAEKVKTVQGTEIGTLDEAKLRTLAHTTATWATNEMKLAATTLLQAKGK